MNIISLEAKFKNIEKREIDKNKFFNPFSSKGPKHYCIKDIHDDYEYDTLLYGLSRYYKLPSEKNNSPSPENRLINVYASNPDVKSHLHAIHSKGNNSKEIKKISNNPSVNNIESMPKITKIITRPLSPSRLSQLKQLNKLEKIKNTNSEEYHGAFSTTRVVKKKKPPEKANNSRISPPE